jgi:hypothetical protein
MKSIYVEGSLKLPEINFNYEKGLIELKGRSTPENTDDIYQPLIDWVKSYVKTPQTNTIINIHFEYFNSSSAKYLTRLLEQLRILKENGYSFEINWFYEDEELMESGRDFSEIVDLDFTYINTK